MIKTVIARKHGGSKVVPLTDFDFIEVDKKYVVRDGELGGERCIIIQEDNEPRIRLEKVR